VGEASVLPGVNLSWSNPRTANRQDQRADGVACAQRAEASQSSIILEDAELGQFLRKVGVRLRDQGDPQAGLVEPEQLARLANFHDLSREPLGVLVVEAEVHRAVLKRTEHISVSERVRRVNCLFSSSVRATRRGGR
jgi:hypothetical protein